MSLENLAGMLTVEQLHQQVQAGRVDTIVLVFADLYGRLLGKRLDADFFLHRAGEHGTHACDYLLTADMEMEPVPGYRLANWERGHERFFKQLHDKAFEEYAQMPWGG